jgi:hypothetical protein
MKIKIARYIYDQSNFSLGLNQFLWKQLEFYLTRLSITLGEHVREHLVILVEIIASRVFHATVESFYKHMYFNLAIYVHDFLLCVRLYYSLSSSI